MTPNGVMAVILRYFSELSIVKKACAEIIRQ